MKTMRWQRQLALFGASFLTAVAASGLLVQSAPAQFGSPPGQGRPKGTAGGGSRPTRPLCLQQPNSQEALLAMAPTQFVGLTPHATPAVWVYVPNTTAKTLEFSLFTQDHEGVYQTNLPIHDAGLLKITLPPETVALTTGKPYYWAAALVCNPKRRTEDWVVGSWIQQQPFTPDLKRQLTEASLEQQVKLYAEADFWYEAFNTYLALRQTQPGNTNLIPLGADLLKAAGLSAIAPQEKLLRITAPSPTTRSTR